MDILKQDAQREGGKVIRYVGSIDMLSKEVKVAVEKYVPFKFSSCFALGPLPFLVL